jgi:hypothetical protein
LFCLETIFVTDPFLLGSVGVAAPTELFLFSNHAAFSSKTSRGAAAHVCRHAGKNIEWCSAPSVLRQRSDSQARDGQIRDYRQSGGISVANAEMFCLANCAQRQPYK